MPLDLFNKLNISKKALRAKNYMNSWAKWYFFIGVISFILYYLFCFLLILILTDLGQILYLSLKFLIKHYTLLSYQNLNVSEYLLYQSFYVLGTRAESIVENLDKDEPGVSDALLKLTILLAPYVVFYIVKGSIWLFKKIKSYFFPSSPKDDSDSDDDQGKKKPGGGGSQTPALKQPIDPDRVPTVEQVLQYNVIPLPESSPLFLVPSVEQILRDNVVPLPESSPLFLVPSVDQLVEDTIVVPPNSPNQYDVPSFLEILDKCREVTGFLRKYPLGLISLSSLLTFFSCNFESTGQLLLEQLVELFFSSAEFRQDVSTIYGQDLLESIDSAILLDKQRALESKVLSTQYVNFAALSLPVSIVLPVIYKVFLLLLGFH